MLISRLYWHMYAIRSTNSDPGAHLIGGESRSASQSLSTRTKFRDQQYAISHATPRWCCVPLKRRCRVGTARRVAAASSWAFGARVCLVATGGSPTERRTESLSGNSRKEGHLLGPSVQEQTPNRTPFCSAPLLVCLLCRFLHCQELALVTALIVMIRVFLKPKPVSGFKESMWRSSSRTAVRGSATSSPGNVKYDSASPVLIERAVIVAVSRR